MLKRRQGLLARLFHMQRRNVRFEALEFMDSILSSADVISNVRWHYDDPEEAVADEPASDVPDRLQ